MSETQKPICESNVNYKRYADWYAGNTSVELDDLQKNLYSELRKIEFDPIHYSKYGPGLWLYVIIYLRKI